MKPNTNGVTVIGAGSWGTALSIHLARKGIPVALWGHKDDRLEEMARIRLNEQYMPGIPFPDALQVRGDWMQINVDTTDVLLAVPSDACRHVLTFLRPRLTHTIRLLCCTKGIDPHSQEFLTEMAENILGSKHHYAVLSGPSFAKEVAREVPTAVVVASREPAIAEHFAHLFSTPRFRVYVSDDMRGVQLAAAVKNVIAIAVGVSDGLGFGANTRSALITRGLAEMIRLGVALGAHTETFSGLAGMGDLVLTCTDDQSRNRRLGLALGRGQTKEQARDIIAQSIEGMQAAEHIMTLAKRSHVDMPITECVYDILYRKLSPSEAVARLLSREVKTEF